MNRREAESLDRYITGNYGEDMEEYLTTREVYEMDKVSKYIALKWARENNVRMVGRDYMWTERDAEAFLRRNRKRGRPKGGGKRG